MASSGARSLARVGTDTYLCACDPCRALGVCPLESGGVSLNRHVISRCRLFPLYLALTGMTLDSSVPERYMDEMSASLRIYLGLHTIYIASVSGLCRQKRTMLPGIADRAGRRRRPACLIIQARWLQPKVVLCCAAPTSFSLVAIL